MKRPVAIDYVEHAVDQLLAFVVCKAAQRDAAAKMRVIVCVTAGAPERTFPGNFNRKRRLLASQNFAPRAEDF
jgi:hypothetical protein